MKRVKDGRTVKQVASRIAEIAQQMHMLSFELKVLTKSVIVPPEYILEIVSEIFDVQFTAVNNTQDRVGMKGRIPGITDKEAIARHAARYLIDKFSQLSRTQITVLTGGVSHSTTIRSIRVAGDMIETDSTFKDNIDKCLNTIKLKYS